MKILLDMNLSPDWVDALAAENIESIHWSAVGDPRARDTEIMDYSHANGYIVLTHDLDFGTILALTYAQGPSVIQVRTQDVLPSTLAAIVISVVKENEPALDRGALMVVDQARARMRILPLEKNN
jgi:predicted nuclease of predicted toxin-antitoxin system